MDPFRVMVAAVMLIGASWWDLRERRVPNLYWFPFVAFAALFLVVDIATARDGGVTAWMPLIGSTVVALLSYLFFRMGLWGGADAKGVMVLAFLVQENLYGQTTVAVMDTLAAGMALVLLLPVGLTVWNLTHGHTAFPAMLMGQVVPLKTARRRRVWPLQTADGWRFRARIGEDVRSIYRDLEKAGKTHVWVTIQLPLMVFIALGFFLVNLFGSPLEWIGAPVRP